MSFNNLIYDNCAYKKHLEESSGVGKYQMYSGKYNNERNCRIDFGVVGGNEVSLYKGNIVDLESELKGQTRLNSLCPNKKFIPTFTRSCDSGLPSGPINCSSQLRDLPTCQLICYNPVIFSEKKSVSMCPGLYKNNKNHIKENFCQDFPKGDFSKNDYQKWFPSSNKTFPSYNPVKIPERCKKCKLFVFLCTCK